jgi:hypothetical protein
MSVDVSAFVEETTEDLQKIWDSFHIQNGTPNSQQIEEILSEWLAADQWRFDTKDEAFDAMRKVFHSININTGYNGQTLKKEIREYLEIQEDGISEQEWNNIKSESYNT